MLEGPVLLQWLQRCDLCHSGCLVCICNGKKRQDESIEKVVTQRSFKEDIIFQI